MHRRCQGAMALSSVYDKVSKRLNYKLQSMIEYINKLNKTSKNASLAEKDMYEQW
ncbi:MAG: hypothetical protein K0S01_3913 [Herbinix sp.]|nr:hypothetical protein [Herbinix sp.]